MLCSLASRLPLCLALLGLNLWIGPVAAQELAPRAYWPAPTGTNVLVLGYQYSTGDVVSDPTLPVTGVESKINYFQLSWQRTLDLFGRTANLQLNLPYSRGKSDGFLNDTFVIRELSGLSDVRARLSINLLGAPAMDGAGFQALRANPRTIVGASILLQAPIGEYESDKLINIGANRWAVKPALGVIWPMRPTWLLEFELGAWFFGDNDDFLGLTRKQDPIVSSELHLVKRFRPGFWASLDANYYFGGESRIGQDIQTELQRNSRIGATVLVPLLRQHAIRFNVSTGIVTKTGGDFNYYGLNYLFAWR